MKKNIVFLIRILRSGGGKSGLVAVASILCNFIGALLEGMAYAFMIFAVSSLIGKPGRGEALFMPLCRACGVGGDSIFYIAMALAIASQILKSSLCYLATAFIGLLLKRMQQSLQSEVFAQIFRFSYPCVHRYKGGALVEYVRSPATFLRPILENGNLFVVGACISLVSFALLLCISWPLTLLTLALFISAFFIHKYFSKRAKEASTRLAKLNATIGAEASESILGMKVIHTYNGQALLLAKMRALFGESASQAKRLICGNGAVSALSEMAGVLTVGLVLCVGTYFFHSQLPLLLGFVTIAYRLSGKMQGAMNSAILVGSHIGEVGVVREILCPDKKEFVREGGVSERGFKESIEFDHLSFGYHKRHTLALQDISCSFQKGKVTAICGQSGSGKSTLIDLLLGLYEPTKGAILIDGHPLEKSDLECFRNLIGVVFQESMIFSGTIEDNIKVGNRDACFEQVQLAAKAAYAEPFIQSLKLGYQTQVGEKGYQLSGGERQRIALARALVRDPEILILDEATSHLDSLSEGYIQEALSELKREKTIILVAHRLSTVVQADTIYVMDKGRIIEIGTHKSLLELEGIYADFWEKQTASVSK